MKVRTGDEPILTTPSQSYDSKDLPKEVITNRIRSLTCAGMNINIDIQLDLAVGVQVFKSFVHGKLLLKAEHDDGLLQFSITEIRQIPINRFEVKTELYPLIINGLTEHFSKVFWQPVTIEFNDPVNLMYASSAQAWPQIQQPKVLF